MPPWVQNGLNAAWSAVGVYWLVSARRARATARSEPFAKRLLAYWLPLVAALVLLGPGDWFGHGLLREALVPHTLPVFAFGVVLCLAGAALAIWSRHLLATDWSDTAELEQGHELIHRGPYRVVRNPSYGGLLLIFLGSALVVGEWRGLLAVAIVFASFWRKLRLEERWLGERFGEPYREYQGRTKALVPGLL